MREILDFKKFRGEKEGERELKEEEEEEKNAYMLFSMQLTDIPICIIIGEVISQGSFSGRVGGCSEMPG